MTLLLPETRLLAIIETQTEVSASALDLDAVMTLVVGRARRLLNASASVVELLDGQEMVYHVASGTAEPFVGLRLRADSSLSGLCVRRDEALHCEDAESDDRVNYDACRRVGAVSMVCIPLRHGDRVVGVLKVYDSRPYAFDERDVQTLQLLSGLIAAQMAHASEFQEQQHASRHDALTGLPNRRGFDERLAGEAARTRRHGGDLALCVLDLDGFKHVNDALGHVAGDDVLRAVARHLERLRGEDVAFRLGGDEFAILLLGATREDAPLIAGRVEVAVRDDPACRGVTVSSGTAMLGHGDPQRMIRRADEALYEVKRNRPR